MRWTIVYCPTDGVPACYGHFKSPEAAQRHAVDMVEGQPGPGTLSVCPIQPIANWAGGTG